MSETFNPRGSRRVFLAALAGAVSGALTPSTSARQESPEEALEACLVEPSVQLMMDWRAGLPVYPSLSAAGPQIDWQPFNHPSFLGPSFVPPGWTPIAAWAESFSPDGVPRWQTSPMAQPQLTLSRVESPDGSAVFEYAIGSIQQALLSTMDGAALARANMVGPGADLRSVCVVDDQHNALSPAWMTVDRHGRDLMITFGNAYPLPGIVPATVVSFNTIFGPRREMETLMYDVFLRILYQFLGGGGSGNPTPTPTP